LLGACKLPINARAVAVAWGALRPCNSATRQSDTRRPTGRYCAYTGHTPTDFQLRGSTFGGSCPQKCVHTSVTTQVKKTEGAQRFYFFPGFLGILGRHLQSFTFRLACKLPQTTSTVQKTCAGGCMGTVVHPPPCFYPSDPRTIPGHSPGIIPGLSQL
jgi:hypothetical protein